MSTAAEGPVGGAAYRAWVLGALVLVYTSNFIDRTILGILQQPIKEELGLADWQLGLLGGATFALFYSIVGIPIARAAERYNRVWIMAISLGIWSVMTALSGMAANYVQLLLYRVGVGVGEAGGTPPAHSLISDYYPAEKRASALSIYSLGIPLGTLFGAILGGYIAQTWGWRTAFFVVGAPGLLLALLLVFTVREPARGVFDKGGAALDPPPLGAVVARLWASRAFRHMAAGISLAGFGGYAIVAFAASWLLRSFDLSIGRAGLIMGLMGGVSAAVGTLLGGFATDRGARTDKRWYAWVPGFGLLIAGPLYALAFLQTDWVLAAALLMVPGVFQYTMLGPTYGVMQNLVDARMRASATALLFLGLNLIGLGGGPTLIGLLSDVFAQASFAGDFNVECAQSYGAGACRDASAVGIRNALLVAAAVMAWGGAHYLLAARHLRRELA